jgi:hypothetical protein
MRRGYRLPAAICFILGAATAASAQSLTAGLPSQGGVGITRHGTGFDGTQGDPDFYVGSSQIPESERMPPLYLGPGTRGGRGPAGTAPGAPGGYGYTPSSPPMQYYYTIPAPQRR